METRTGFPPLQTLGSRGNMANPAESGTSTTRSDAQSVHIVHTLFFALSTSASKALEGLKCGSQKPSHLLVGRPLPRWATLIQPVLVACIYNIWMLERRPTAER